jgi:hypothetical protein
LRQLQPMDRDGHCRQRQTDEGYRDRNKIQESKRVLVG